MVDPDAALLDHPLGGVVGFPLGHRVAVVVAPLECQPVGLLDVKDGVAAHQRRARGCLLSRALGGAGRLVGGARLRLLLLVIELVKEHLCRLLALADLPIQLRDPRPAAPHRAPPLGSGAHAGPPQRLRRVRGRRGVTGETDRPAGAGPSHRLGPLRGSGDA